MTRTDDVGSTISSREKTESPQDAFPRPKLVHRAHQPTLRGARVANICPHHMDLYSPTLQTDRGNYICVKVQPV